MLTPGTIKRRLAPYFARRREVLLAYLFGSVAQGRMNKLSDIDIALLVDEKKFKKLDAKEPYGYKAAMIANLMGLLHKNEIDLVLLHEAPPLLAHEVIRTGTLLFYRNENERIAFEVQTKKNYLDTKPLREIKRHYLYERIARGDFSEVTLPSSTET